MPTAATPAGGSPFNPTQHPGLAGDPLVNGPVNAVGPATAESLTRRSSTGLFAMPSQTSTGLPEALGGVTRSSHSFTRGHPVSLGMSLVQPGFLDGTRDGSSLVGSVLAASAAPSQQPLFSSAVVPGCVHLLGCVLSVAQQHLPQEVASAELARTLCGRVLGLHTQLTAGGSSSASATGSSSSNPIDLTVQVGSSLSSASGSGIDSNGSGSSDGEADDSSSSSSPSAAAAAAVTGGSSSQISMQHAARTLTNSCFIFPPVLQLEVEEPQELTVVLGQEAVAAFQALAAATNAAELPTQPQPSEFTPAQGGGVRVRPCEVAEAVDHHPSTAEAASGLSGNVLQRDVSSSSRTSSRSVNYSSSSNILEFEQVDAAPRRAAAAAAGSRTPRPAGGTAAGAVGGAAGGARAGNSSSSNAAAADREEARSTAAAAAAAAATGRAGRDIRVVLFSSGGDVVVDQFVDLTADYLLR